jgi:hypothetical protein
MNMSFNDLHRIALATMADCPPDAEAAWLDCLHDALTATYTRHSKSWNRATRYPSHASFFAW